MEQIFLKPRKDVLVRDPISYTPLPEKGLMVDWNSYWRRRVKCGDAFVSSPEVKKEQEPETEKEFKPKRGRNK